ncbi:D-alanyl-D-alanine carboxypeptidase [Martelella alba]|uniref:D-alanyl-D-alanine carboxypeptidase n=1 Tax=Martelella alba TaxID=2590451 RepID=A0A506UCF2_9HYPH|nr:D-alanyl-D-alanine carboxypeptidase family protein [Martelella alba]TPW32112.1 D-alanyl-D-alanine carboxypeptidase [Martelella alba]
MTGRTSQALRRLPLILLTLVVTALLPAAGASANPYIVVDAKTQRVLFADEAFRRWYPASLTKLMTTYLVFEDLVAGRQRLDTPITVSAAAANEAPSKMYFAPGTRISLDSALKMMLVHSANDAAKAVAENEPGGEQAFVARMNATAAKLGMNNTHFVNANGMPEDGQYTTARDMAALALALQKNFPQFAYFFDIPGISADSGRYRNTNLLLPTFDGATGMKTGYICAAGYNQVSTAKRDGHSVVSVVLGASSIPDRTETSARLLQSGLTVASENGPLLSAFRPGPDADKTVADISSTMCTPEAIQARIGVIDEDGNYPLNSPYLKPLPKDYATVPAKRLPNDTDMAAAELDQLKTIPLPYARPAQ